MGEYPEIDVETIEICNYCRHAGIFYHREIEEFRVACTLEKGRVGNYKRVFPKIYPDEEIYTALGKVTDVIDSLKGCGKFSPSGLEAFPLAAHIMAYMNPLAKGIPVNPMATEKGKDFRDKIVKYPHTECDFLMFKFDPPEIEELE
jgi:hypothetical protein